MVRTEVNVFMFRGPNFSQITLDGLAVDARKCRQRQVVALEEFEIHTNRVALKKQFEW